MSVTIRCTHCGHTVLTEDASEVPAGLCTACGKVMRTPGEGANRAPSARFSPARTKGFSDPLLFGMSANGLILLFLCVGSVVAVLIPALNSARESARLNSCTCNGKNLGLSLHNYHDIHGSLPLASTAPATATPGASAQAGYSWIVQLLPFMEELPLYEQIQDRSSKFEKLPFDSALKGNNPAMPVVSNVIFTLVCPSAGKTHVDPAASAVYKESPLPGISNYISTTASHLTNVQGPIALPDGGRQAGLSGNGVLIFPTDVLNPPVKGLTLKSITDGTSKTIFICESREEIYAAWIDGQTTWGVAAWPENIEIPTNAGASDGFLGWPDANTSGRTSLEVAMDDDPALFYMAKTRFGGSVDRKFGPSSNHPKGKVIHCFADGHVSAILTSEVDRNIYLRIYARGGQEPVFLD